MLPLVLSWFALRSAMTSQLALTGLAFSVALGAAVPALRRVLRWFLQYYGEATQTAFLLLFIYALLSAPILITWMVTGVKP
jgi:hypothetical protein